MIAKKIFILITTCLAFLLQPYSAVSEELPSANRDEAIIAQNPALADLITYAYKTNPTVDSYRKAWEAEVEKYRIDTAYPDPQLMLTYFPDPIETRLGPQDWNAQLSQEIPFPGQLSAKGNVIEADIRIAHLNLDKAVRDLIAQIRESYHELVYIRAAKEIADNNSRLISHLKDIGGTDYANNQAALSDILKIQSQEAQLGYDVILLDELEQTESARLNALLDRAPDAVIGRLEPPPISPILFTLDEISALADDNREELKISKAMLDKAEAGKTLSTFQNLPNFKLGLFYAGIGEPEGMTVTDAGRDAVGIQAGISIPLWFGKSRGRSLKARAEVARARALHKNQQNDTHVQVRNSFFRLNNSLRLVTLYRDQLIPQALRSVEISETWNRQGKGTFTDYLEAQATYYNFQLALARASADYGKYLAQLEKLTGRSLTDKARESTP
ncbi:MAG: TolC family protein [Proteobacteria bacterium]|nr:TolC family protein [Pseudomonadota bacterium]MBU1711379.1 TolC family protein [Pseudomonadota bacterium]